MFPEKEIKKSVMNRDLYSRNSPYVWNNRCEIGGSLSFPRVVGPLPHEAGISRKPCVDPANPPWWWEKRQLLDAAAREELKRPERQQRTPSPQDRARQEADRRERSPRTPARFTSDSASFARRESSIKTPRKYRANLPRMEM